MNITINIDNIDKLTSLYSTKYKSAVTKSVRRAINRTLPTYNRDAKNLIKKAIKLPKKYSITKIMSRKKYTGGSDIEKMHGTITVKSSAISLIHFVKGRKTPPKQKGVRVSNRKNLKYGIKPGQTSVAKGAFIARGRNGNTQVFRRMGGTKSSGSGVNRTNKAVRKIGGPNPAKLLADSNRIRRIQKRAKLKFKKEYNKSLLHLLSKMRSV